jgi:hypothetical protein
MSPLEYFVELPFSCDASAIFTGESEMKVSRSCFTAASETHAFFAWQNDLAFKNESQMTACIVYLGIAALWMGFHRLAAPAR